MFVQLLIANSTNLLLVNDTVYIINALANVDASGIRWENSCTANVVNLEREQLLIDSAEP